MIVEHNLDLVLALADRAYVLERGSVVHQGPAARAARRSRTAPARALDVSDMEQIAAIIGAGLIGRAWAMVFARAGWRVRLYDAVPAQLDRGARS